MFIPITVLANNCHLVFDAGSSGTRLHAYQFERERVLEVFNEKINQALSWELEEINTQEDTDKMIKNLSQSFLSQGICQKGIESVYLYGTAGMRLME